MLKVLIYIILFLFPFYLFGQEYNYVHYDTKDGLAGSTVYDIFQDKDGYIWFATEFGVSRFDGTTFKNFTTDNGLTDNEVLKLLPDRNGRVWFFPFNKTLCYYYKNKIINAEHIYNLNIHNKISQFGEGDNGGLYIISNNQLLLLKSNGEKKIIADLKNLADMYKIKYKNLNEVTFYRKVGWDFNKLEFLIGNYVFLLNEKGLKFIRINKSSLIDSDSSKNSNYFFNDKLEKVSI